MRGQRHKNCRQRLGQGPRPMQNKRSGRLADSRYLQVDTGVLRSTLTPCRGPCGCSLDFWSAALCCCRKYAGATTLTSTAGNEHRSLLQRRRKCCMVHGESAAKVCVTPCSWAMTHHSCALVVCNAAASASLYQHDARL